MPAKQLAHVAVSLPVHPCWHEVSLFAQAHTQVA
jgi:hypothetical protein